VIRYFKLAPLAVICFALLAGPAFGAKGGSGGSGKGSTTSATPPLTLNQTNVWYGGTVSFTVNASGASSTPMVRVLCSENGLEVYGNAQASDGSASWSPQFTLASSTWAANPGSAQCGADLYYYTWRGQVETGVVYLAHVDFTVSG
jgi:hypothetical protein